VAARLSSSALVAHVVVDVVQVVVVGTILGVALILALLAWRAIRAFKRGASPEDGT